MAGRGHFSPDDMEEALEQRISGIAGRFAIAGRYVDGREIESGHINATFEVTYETADGRRERYVIQRINQRVFRDPLAVMRNVECVTRHIQAKVLRLKRDSAGRTLSLYPGRDGRFWVEGPGGGVWRCYNFVEGCRTHDVVASPRQAEQAARAFGEFQNLVSDLPPDEIEETIPHFHDTPLRYDRLMEVAAADPCGRAGGVAAELEFIRARADEIGRVMAAMRAGEVPRRITHNDTKINNVMMDEVSDEAVCVIDLDTVMPGSVLFDFGDLVRTSVSPAAEDEVDLKKVEVRMPVYEALVRGYLSAAGGFLNEAEVGLLGFSARLITLEVAIRFLTDHLEGDVYFRSHRPGHNLDRCRAQLALVERFEDRMAEMEECVVRIRKATEAPRG